MQYKANSNKSSIENVSDLESLTKIEYLKDQYVDGLIKYIVSLECGIKLNHQYEVKYPAWKKWLKDEKHGTKIHINSLSDALEEYFWVAQDEGNDDEVDDNVDRRTKSKLTSYSANTDILKNLSESLIKSVKNKNDKDIFINCIKVLEWGQVFKGSVRWIIDAYEQGKLCDKISIAVKILDGENSFNLNEFMNGTVRMDSGLTKIYSLASDNSIIYDDRVGAALGLLAKNYLKSIPNYTGGLPLNLNFMPGRTKERNPSEVGFQFKGRGKNPSYIQARSNLMANWLVSEIVSKLKSTWDRRSVEAALFMIGYRVQKDGVSFDVGNEQQIADVTPDDLLAMLNEGGYDDFVKAIRAQPACAVSEPTLLIKAVNLSSKDCVEVLLAHGADANPRSNSPFHAGKSLLLMAVGFGDFEIARSLLSHGADPYAGFQGPPDFGLLLAKYAPTGLLTRSQYDALIDGLRAGHDPITSDLK